MSTASHFIQTCKDVLHTYEFANLNELREEYVVAIKENETIPQESLALFKAAGYTWRASYKYQGRRAININIFESST